jgi:hypothetical protein
VRVYHGEQTKLPRHYVPRERFYLRATVDYWVNALDGQPFCYFNQAVDHGLVQAMRGDVLPWLEAQTSLSAEHRQRMAADPRVPRFTVVFDREGYSPDLFRELQQRQIAALTYHRYPDGEDWRAEEFQEQVVSFGNGESVRLKLAERGMHVGRRPGLWVREVRKLGADGHQIPIVSTNFSGDATAQAAALMARWSQENFFKYMREHFGLDALVQYGTEQMPATVTVVNPAWQELNRQVRKKHKEWKAIHFRASTHAGKTSGFSSQTSIHSAISSFSAFFSGGVRLSRARNLRPVLGADYLPPAIASALPISRRLRLRIDPQHLAPAIAPAPRRYAGESRVGLLERQRRLAQQARANSSPTPAPEPSADPATPLR